MKARRYCRFCGKRHTIMPSACRLKNALAKALFASLKNTQAGYIVHKTEFLENALIYLKKETPKKPKK